MASLKYQELQRHYNFLRIWKRRYYEMSRRQKGCSSHQSNGAKGKDIMELAEFMEWCMDFDNLNVFLTLYFDWAHNGFNRWDSPSIDRIESNKGYVASNLQ